MKFPLIISLFLLTIVMSGCGVVESIFKAGMWWAFILMAVVVGFILWIVSKMRRK